MREQDGPARHHHTRRHQGVGQHVGEGAADIEVALAAGSEQGRRRAVHQDAGRRHDHHRHAGGRFGREQAPRRFGRYGAGNH